MNVKQVKSHSPYLKPNLTNQFKSNSGSLSETIILKNPLIQMFSQVLEKENKSSLPFLFRSLLESSLIIFFLTSSR